MLIMMAAAVSAEWKFVERTDPMTDAALTAAAIESNEGHATMLVICKPTGISIGIQATTGTVDLTADAETRVDKRPMEKVHVAVQRDSVVFVDSTALMKRVIQGEKLLVRAPGLDLATFKMGDEGFRKFAEQCKK